jgi:carbonic anhydrase/acetyltransferase-like protein (isoleucine patch superfamily)
MRSVFMTLYEFEGKKPLVREGSYVFESADVVGNVRIGKGCYVGPGARIRGDYGRIEVGDFTAIEDNVVVHARPDDATTIGSHVTIGHGAVVHNATVKDWSVIGMGAIVSDWAEVGVWGVVAEGAVVKNHDKIPDGKVAIGVPAKVVADVDERFKAAWTSFKEIYVQLASKRYPESLRKMSMGKTENPG